MLCAFRGINKVPEYMQAEIQAAKPSDCLDVLILTMISSDSIE